ncbi:MAG: type II secretion system protein GspF, partial [Nitrospirae bacterium]
TLGFLLKGGVPIVRALELAGNACGNVVLYQRVKEAATMVSEGASLSGSLEGVSPVLRQLIHTGETSGTLAELMERTSQSYRDEFLRGVDRALALLEPAMVLVMGVVVGFIVFAVLLPIFQVNQLVR